MVNDVFADPIFLSDQRVLAVKPIIVRHPQIGVEL